MTTELLKHAFRALDAGATPREFDAVASALIASQDESTLRILDEAARDDEARGRLGKDFGQFTALDLVTAVAMRRRQRER